MKAITMKRDTQVKPSRPRLKAVFNVVQRFGRLEYMPGP
jgi:hypothetical protein